MEVDQEGVPDLEPEDDHGTEQANLAFDVQHQYDDPPPGGWNHDMVDLTQTNEGPVIDVDADFDIQEDMLRLGLRIYEAFIEASKKEDVRKEHRLYDLLNKVRKVMQVGESNHPPFHGTIEGYETRLIK
eukprot:2735255-Heterocapsa_arctica.AAC.2